MSVDLSQFHQVFFEESFEGLDIMESSLMELDPDDVDSEVINAIFRAAHSIKGGSGTFGFNVIADFTHVLETLLDEIRDEKRSMTQDYIDLFLQSVDCLRELLTSLQQDEETDPTQAEALKKDFNQILNNESGTQAASTSQSNAAEEDDATGTHWHIVFKPGKEVMQKGNDPLRILRELQDMGDFSVKIDTGNLPALTDLNVEECYLFWEMTLAGDGVCQAAIEKVFEWVIDESTVDITAVNEDKNGSVTTGWQVKFQPGLSILQTGNEPCRMFSELFQLGKVTVTPLLEKMPSLSAMNPEECHLGWDIEIQGAVEQSQIEEVFEWVVDESDIVITPIAAPVKSDQSAAQVSESADSNEQSAPATSGNEASGKSAQPAKKAAGKAPAKSSASTESSSIRVGIDKIDNLINMVGELVITQSMLGQLGTSFDMNRLPNLLEGLGQLEQNTRELQESVMRIRMLPISFAFSRYPRLARDLSKRLGKQIDLELKGEQTELDKTVMEKIGDPLVHLVRNAIDHGIELPEDREKVGKSPTGKITLNAYHQGGNVVIEIIDDGKGLHAEKILEKAIDKGLVTEKEGQQMAPEQIYELIFYPGFSTASEVSDLSGRGVGMDVVKRNINELNGSVEVRSAPGEGSTFTIRLPLTLAILDGQLVRVGTDTYIFPLVSIVESLQSRSELVSQVAGGCDVFQLRNEYVPIIRLFEIFTIEPDSQSLDDSLLVVVECDGEKVGIVVDELLGQQQVVIKSLEQNYHRVEGVSGATILGDGTVALILDIPGIVKLAGVKHQGTSAVTSLAQSHSSPAMSAAIQ